MISDYTSPDTIRALLGVNDLEVEDSRLALDVYTLIVESGLDDLSKGVSPMYDLVRSLPEASRTSQQKRYYNSVQMYSATLVALELIPSLPVAVPRKIGDEKAVIERVNDPFKALEEGLAASLAVLGSRIKATLAILDPTFTSSSTIRRFASTVGLSPDPVTGA